MSPTLSLGAVTAVLLLVLGRPPGGHRAPLRGPWLSFFFGLLETAAGQTAPSGCQDGQHRALGAVPLAGAPALQAGAVALLTGVTGVLGGNHRAVYGLCIESVESVELCRIGMVCYCPCSDT